MNLSGIAVMCQPQHVLGVVEALNALEGVEVHQYDDEKGKIVVVQEATDVKSEVEGLKQIKALPHVTVAELVYHYFEDNAQPSSEIPADLNDMEGLDYIPSALVD
jgi:periplasmic nitrate reductase NapD